MQKGDLHTNTNYMGREYARASKSIEETIYPRFGPFGTKSGRATPRNNTIPQRSVKAMMGIAEAPIFFLSDHLSLKK